MSEIYGHRKLSMFFRPLVEIDDSGFIYRGSHYEWTDIQDIFVHDSALLRIGWLPAGTARAKIVLKNGEKIRINGRTIEKKGVKPHIGFFSERSDAFDELVKTFENKSHAPAA